MEPKARLRLHNLCILSANGVWKIREGTGGRVTDIACFLWSTHRGGVNKRLSKNNGDVFHGRPIGVCEEVRFVVEISDGDHRKAFANHGAMKASVAP